jgi:hypothetical protein
MAKFWAIPVRNDGTEICGSVSSVLVDGRYVPVSVFYGDYKSSATFVRYVVSKHAMPGVTYNIRKSYGAGETSGVLRVFTKS